MACMSDNDECSSGNSGDSLQSTNWILDSVAMCHMQPEVSDFIPGSLEDMDKHIKVADRNPVTSGKKIQVRIKMCDNHRDPFITTLHNVLLAPDLCDGLFPIIALLNSGNTYVFHKEFCTVYFRVKEKNVVTLLYIAQGQHALLGEIKEMSKINKLPARKKNALELLHQRLRHR